MLRTRHSLVAAVVGTCRYCSLRAVDLETSHTPVTAAVGDGWIRISEDGGDGDMKIVAADAREREELNRPP